MGSSRVPCCRVIANAMPAIQSIATGCDEWLVPMRSNSRRHLLSTTREFPVVAANAIPNHVQCMSIRKIDIRSANWMNKCNEKQKNSNRESSVLPPTMTEPVVSHSPRNIWTEV